MTHGALCTTYVGQDRTLVRVALSYLSQFNACDLVEVIMAQVQASGRKEVYLDFGQVEELDEFMLVRLAVLHFELEKIGGRLWSIQMDPQLYEMLREYGLGGTLHVYCKAARCLHAAHA